MYYFRMPSIWFLINYIFIEKVMMYLILRFDVIVLYK